MDLSETLKALKKLPAEVTESVTPHIGGLKFFAGILDEDIEADGLSKKDALKMAFDYAKKQLKASGMPALEKARFLAGLPKLARDSENHMRILKQAVAQIERPENTVPLNQEWAARFFEHSKKISDKAKQAELGRILADELENKTIKTEQKT